MLEVQAQRLVQHLTVPLGEGLQIKGAPAAAQDPQHRHQRQEPLRVTKPAAITPSGIALRKLIRSAGAFKSAAAEEVSCIGSGVTRQRDPMVTVPPRDTGTAFMAALPGEKLDNSIP